jgi:NADH:ubiquinone oxidoreductase subunit 2 (subunit N)
MSMNNQASIESAIRGRYQVLLILWAAQMTALAAFFLLALLVFQRKESSDSTLFWILAGLNVLLVAVSFAVKQKFFAQAMEKQSVALVQQGQVVAIALCEAAGLFGLLARAITGTPYFYLLFIVPALGMLLHFPRREALMAASFRNRI